MEAERGTTDRSIEVLRGAGVPAGAAVLFIAAGLALIGARAASFAFGGAMALAVLAVAPLLQRYTRRMDPTVFLGVAVLAYATVVVGLMYTYSLVNDMSWVRVPPVAFGVLTAILGWCTAALWMQRQRIVPRRS